jgi:cob(I)alamin adenosyltransferase
MKKAAKNATAADIASAKFNTRMSKVKIYTRTGDKGTTSLYGGKRVEKHNLQVESYGTIDELNSALGVLVSSVSHSLVRDFYIQIQNDLFSIGSHLANAKVDLDPIEKRVGEIEKFIDSLDNDLSPLKNFILPGGVKEAAFAHLARSICRRAERIVIKLSKESDVDKRVIMYLNRLSDCLFQTARFLNHESHVSDVIWKK